MAEAPADRRALGAHAKRLLDDPVLALVFERIGHDLVEQILDSPVGDTKAREAAYHLHWATQQFRTQLRLMLADSKILEDEDRRRTQRENRDRLRREAELDGRA